MLQLRQHSTIFSWIQLEKLEIVGICRAHEENTTGDRMGQADRVATSSQVTSATSALTGSSSHTGAEKSLLCCACAMIPPWEKRLFETRKMLMATWQKSTLSSSRKERQNWFQSTQRAWRFGYLVLWLLVICLFVYFFLCFHLSLLQCLFDILGNC